MNEFIDVWVLGLAAATLRFAAPLIFASLGGLISERSGVVNIALEGMMTAGAFFAIFGSVQSGSWLGGIVCAAVAGGLLGVVHAAATVSLHADQIISGTAIILIAGGLVNFLNLSFFGAEGTPANISVPPVVADVSILVPLAFLTVAGMATLLFATPFGLRLRSVGEHPRAADTVGINVKKMRYIAVVASGVLAGIGGAFISFNVSSYTENMVAGNGFIALAAVIFGKWKPVPTMAACLLFGLSQGLAPRLNSVAWLPEALKAPELLAALPYIITLVAIAGFVGKSVAPAAVGKPYTGH